MAVVEIEVPIRVPCPVAPTRAQVARVRDAVTRAATHGIDRATRTDEAGPGGTVELRAPQVRFERRFPAPVRAEVRRAVEDGVRTGLRARRDALTTRFGAVGAEPRSATALTHAEVLSLLWSAYGARTGGAAPWPPPRDEHPGILTAIVGQPGTWLVVARAAPTRLPDGTVEFADSDLTVLPVTTMSPRGEAGRGALPGGTTYRLERFGEPRTYPQLAEDLVARGTARLTVARRARLVADVVRRLEEIRFGTQPYAISGIGQTFMVPAGALPDVVIAVAPRSERADSAPVDDLLDGVDSTTATARHPLLEVADVPRLHALGARVAAALDMPGPTNDTDLPRFLVRAAARYEQLAREAGSTGARETTAADSRVRPRGDGNNGVLDVAAAPSPAIDRLRALGAALEPFVAMIADCAKIAAWTPSSTESEIGAMNSYLIDVPDALHRAVARQLAEACRVILLQQLRSSAQTIAARRAHLGETVEMMGASLRVLGPDLERFLLLQRALRTRRVALSAAAASLGAGGTVAAASGGGASVGDVVGHLRDELRSAWHLTPEMWTGLMSVELRTRADGEIVAAWEGHELSDADLSQRIAAQRRLMNLVDPLFLQIEAIEPLAHRVRRDPDHLESFLRDLLGEMAEANTEITHEVADDEDGAWRAVAASRYVEAASRPGVLRYELHGIHALAHAVIEGGATGEGARAALDRGTNTALFREHSRDIALQVAGGIGIVVLTVLCAPLGAVVAGTAAVAAGGALAAYDMIQAFEAEQTFRALEDPEQVLLWHDVEVAQIMAVVSIGLSIVTDVLPVARGAISAVRAELRAAAREGAERGLRELATTSLQAAYRESAARMAEQVGSDLVRHAATQLAATAVLEQVLPLVVTPVLGPLVEAVRSEHGGRREAGADDAPTGTEVVVPPGDVVEETWIAAQLRIESGGAR